MKLKNNKCDNATVKTPKSILRQIKKGKENKSNFLYEGENMHFWGMLTNKYQRLKPLCKMLTYLKKQA